MRRVLNIHKVNYHPQIENQRRKSGCYFKCVDETVGTLEYKKKCEKLNNKLNQNITYVVNFFKILSKINKYVCQDCFCWRQINTSL